MHRRRLGASLRSLRAAAGMTLAEAAAKLGMQAPTLSRVENGKQRVPIVSLAGYFEIYEPVPEEQKAKIRALATLASSGKRSNLLDQFTGVVKEGDSFAEYLNLSELAVREERYTCVVPGLLQTREYARSVVERSRSWSTRREIDNFVALRMARQERISRAKEPLGFWCVLDEAALHRQVGDRRVMREQLGRLLELTGDRPHVGLQVLPFSYGAHAGIDGAFSLLHFPAGSPVALVESMTTTLYLEEEANIGRYEAAFQYLRSEALDTDGSRRLIRQLLKDRA
ncbi:helix-turn-helix domain-containing protein [Streptomyces sp. P6-2-1]|uniref:helix-turn-helix domain-containing protein n=1 Tax=unclassified Streptomyces TaxID=2593676 RepID=UPI003D35E0B8